MKVSFWISKKSIISNDMKAVFGFCGRVSNYKKWWPIDGTLKLRELNKMHKMTHYFEIFEFMFSKFTEELENYL